MAESYYIQPKPDLCFTNQSGRVPHLSALFAEGWEYTALWREDWMGKQ
jgi:hypothetical protein